VPSTALLAGEFSSICIQQLAKKITPQLKRLDGYSVTLSTEVFYIVVNTPD
jgi:hypothetical protein